MKFHQDQGYLLYSPVKDETNFREVTAMTLEYADDDCCFVQLAKPFFALVVRPVRDV